MSRYHEIAFTPAVRAEQKRHGSDRAYRVDDSDGSPEPLGELEREFITGRDSFYVASINEDGWPYIQHRGGPPGFVHVIDEHTLAFADFRGNRQYVSVGNLAGDDRVALFFMDYARRIRLKAFGHARVIEARDDPALIARLTPPGYPARVERAFVLTLEGTDWNCSQHIPQLVPVADVREALHTMQRRIDELERRLSSAGGGTG